MKRILTIILFFTLPLFSHAQFDPNWGFITAGKADSLKHTLSIEKNDTVLMNSYRSLAFYYGETNADSSLYFSQKNFALAKKLNIQIWLADAYYQLANCYLYLNNVSAANENLLQAIHIAADEKNEKSNWHPWTFSNARSMKESRIAVLGMAYIGFGSLYSLLADSTKMRAAYHEAIRLGQSINNGKILSLAYGNTAFNLAGDSMVVYAKKAIEYAKSSGYKKFISSGLRSIANGLIAKGQIDSAKAYLYAAVQASREQDNKREEFFDYNLLAFYYAQQRSPDSATHYAKSMLTLAEELKIPDIRSDAYKINAMAYNMIGNKDSENVYLVRYAILNDSLTNTRVKQLTEYQQSSFNEQERLTEINREKSASQNRIKLYTA